MTGQKPKCQKPTTVAQWSRLLGIQWDTLDRQLHKYGIMRAGDKKYEYDEAKPVIARLKAFKKGEAAMSLDDFAILRYKDFLRLVDGKGVTLKTAKPPRTFAERAMEKPAPLPSPQKEVGPPAVEKPEDTRKDPEITPGDTYILPDGSIDSVDWSDSDCMDPDTGEMDVEKREKKYRGLRQKLAAARDRSELVKRDFALGFINEVFVRISTAVNSFPDRTSSEVLAIASSGLAETDKSTEIRRCLEKAADGIIAAVNAEMADTGGKFDAAVQARIDRMGGKV